MSLAKHSILCKILLLKTRFHTAVSLPLPQKHYINHVSKFFDLWYKYEKRNSELIAWVGEGGLCRYPRGISPPKNLVHLSQNTFVFQKHPSKIVRILLFWNNVVRFFEWIKCPSVLPTRFVQFNDNDDGFWIIFRCSCEEVGWSTK